jgi:hypothetical protein
MTDAHPPQNAMMAGIIEQQAWGGTMPEMILVGIQNTNRSPKPPKRISSGYRPSSNKSLAANFH